MCSLIRHLPMGWLRFVGSLKLQVSFAEYCLFYRALLQKRPIILRSLLIVATPYLPFFDTTPSCLPLFDCIVFTSLLIRHGYDTFVFTSLWYDTYFRIKRNLFLCRKRSSFHKWENQTFVSPCHHSVRLMFCDLFPSSSFPHLLSLIFFPSFSFPHLLSLIFPGQKEKRNTWAAQKNKRDMLQRFVATNICNKRFVATNVCNKRFVATNICNKTQQQVSLILQQMSNICVGYVGQS